MLTQQSSGQMKILFLYLFIDILKSNLIYLKISTKILNNIFKPENETRAIIVHNTAAVTYSFYALSWSHRGLANFKKSTLPTLKMETLCSSENFCPLIKLLGITAKLTGMRTSDLILDSTL